MAVSRYYFKSFDFLFFFIKNESNFFLEIKPFHLYHNYNERYLDPIHNLLHWIALSKITKGFIFRKITAHDQVSQENKPLVSIVLSEN